ncbi:Major allergen Mal d 1 [Hibiscus syriacus]|uniref:Major allergen Mal d 1 n=1 Tax=Hibiscus syriacus TaxID=106335 RepID=A0A6A2Z213_HIBSY|nr:major allergen Pru ar 1-like isoform X1 [Hibiscus syriacus]KAE8685767.1 Major allergen Mal d 1 [Hibiscus syriacus]
MGVFTHEMEVSSPLPTGKAFKSFVLESDTLFPKAAPFAIKGVEYLEGNGGPGSIRKVTFVDGWGFDYLKEKIDDIDQDNLSYTYTVIESDLFKNIIEKISYETKFAAAPNGGTTVKVTTHFYSVGDIEIKEEAVKDSLEKRARVFKAVEEYLLANPDA